MQQQSDMQQLPATCSGRGHVCLRALIEESVGAQQHVPSVSIVLGATQAFAGHHQAVLFEDQLVKEMKLMLGSTAKAPRLGAGECAQLFPATPWRESTWKSCCQTYRLGLKESISSSLPCQLEPSATPCTGN